MLNVGKTPPQIMPTSSLQHILLLQCPYNYKQEAGHDGASLWYLSLRQASFPVLFEDVPINLYVISQLSADLEKLGSQLEHWWYLGDQNFVIRNYVH